ncbi:MAG TPA: 2Fe-2S iron-sulfur cluster-binding protein, partial [Candidatus Marinimicrobia bacterium]|nr:2Fe-2S iron-sulfur cluster-binding protein [Candidatus Neomarinimicrobiota bacterium]
MKSNAKVQIRLEPLGRVIEVDAGSALKDVLFEQGVEFPCGGRGVCRKCRIKILKGNLTVNEIQKKALTSEEISQGWRLACQCQVTKPLVIELAQLEISILADATRIKPAGEDSLAVAVDLGTTTLVAQLL